MPDITVDGTTITGITVDGVDVTEVTVDGSVAWTSQFDPSSISSLAHWYDATEISGSDGDAIGTWADQEGTDDLTQATSSKKPTLRTSGINSKNILEYDGSDDLMEVDFTDISTPYYVFVVASKRTGSTDATDYLYDGVTENISAFWGDQDANGNDWTMYSGSRLNSGTTEDANDHIHTHLWNGASSVMRLDGTQIASGDPGASTLDGLIVSNRADEDTPSPYDVGEILVYNADLSDSDRNDVESYLSDKWGITI